MFAKLNGIIKGEQINKLKDGVMIDDVLVKASRVKLKKVDSAKNTSMVEISTSFLGLIFLIFSCASRINSMSFSGSLFPNNSAILGTECMYCLVLNIFLFSSKH